MVLRELSVSRPNSIDETPFARDRGCFAAFDTYLDPSRNCQRRHEGFISISSVLHSHNVGFVASREGGPLVFDLHDFIILPRLLPSRQDLNANAFLRVQMLLGVSNTACGDDRKRPFVLLHMIILLKSQNP